MSLTKRSWEWNEDRWGYDGVHAHGEKLVWFTHKHNPHGGGGGSTQDFKDFLANGTKANVPTAILDELREVVEAIVKEG